MVTPSCSFCGKTKEQTRKIIGGAEGYICYDCVAICNDVIKDELEFEPKGSLHAYCDFCRTPWNHDKLLLIPERGHLCPVCVNAIRRVFQESGKEK